MKVLLITSYTAGSFEGNFYHYYLNDHIQRYKAFGHVTACCKIKENDNVGKKVDLHDVTIREIKKVNSIGSLLKYNRRNKEIIAEEIRKADLIICYVPTYLALYTVSLAKKLHKKVLAVAVSCVWDAYWNHSVKGKMMAPFSFINMKRIMKMADYSIYVTSEFLQHRYPPQGKTVAISDVVLDGVENDLLSKRLSKINEVGSDFTRKPFNIITCAALNVRYKRQEDVIEAMAKIKDINIHYYLAGGGDNTRILKIAQKYNLTDRVHFLGMLTRDKIFQKLDEMDLYVQPSKQEGLPRALVEAMSRALPAIGSTTGGIPELLGKEFIFKKGNVTELKNLILKMMDSEQRINSAKSNFRKAMEFDTELLNKKRDDFFKMITDEMSADTVI